MRKPSLIGFIGRVFLAQAIFFVCSHPSSYAAAPSGCVADSAGCVMAGHEAQKKGDVDKALEFFNKAVSLDAKNAAAWVGLGYVQMQKGKTNEAIESFNKNISINAKDPAPYIGLANLYLSKGDKEAALKQYKIVKGLDKKLAEELDKRIQSS